MYIRRRPCKMCSESSAPGTSIDTCTDTSKDTCTDTCDARGSGRSEYVHFTAKDSDSDSEIEEALCADVHEEEKHGAAVVCVPAVQTASPPSSVQCVQPPTVQNTGLSVVPDHEGVRFCRVCNAFLPLSMFPKGHRRYTCRPHLWQRIGKKARQAAYRAMPRRKLLASIWTRCWKDVKNSRLGLQQDLARMHAPACSPASAQASAQASATASQALTLALKQADIGGMLDALEARQSRRFNLPSVSSASSADSTHAAKAQAKAHAELMAALDTAADIQRCPGPGAVAVLPVDLTVPLSKQNAVLVTKSTRKVLLDKLRRARKALSVRNTRNAQAPNAAAQAEQQISQQKQLVLLWRKSIQAVTLLPAAPVGFDVSPEAVGSGGS